ncbi:Organic cation/carnitine transporter [Arachis hypogaea]|uniref:Nodulin-like domain-containing protein n=1 Tax=Arachis hypogaea TaxID=3818 RepID=A0A445B7J9_ARAHY|nr:Organic cation/carnitine transporter [Arachis hypogaea]RYR34644.1 hypothetical protein Ahy_A10g049616 [Arachis hypogaea]
MVAINFLCAIVYYGLSLNMVNLDTNLYMNVVLNAVAEMPAYGIMALVGQVWEEAVVNRNNVVQCYSHGGEECHTTQAGQMGAILSQVVVVLGRLPFVVFAVCGIMGGMFAFYLPKTLNQPLYDTFFRLEAGLV